MNGKTDLLAVCMMSAIFLGACSKPSGSLTEHGGAARAPYGTPRSIAADTVCSLASRSIDFCQTDFVRLASNTKGADGKNIWIVGFLAVDSRQLVLYANRDAFELVENGQSILIRSNYSNLVQLRSEYGNQEVRIRGTFRAAQRNSPDSSRLGTLQGKLFVKRAERRSVANPTEGLVVPIEDLESKGAEAIILHP